MTQSNPTAGLWVPPTPRRTPNGGYRISQAGSRTLGTKRAVGMWVPAEAFRRGTVIRATGSGAASAIYVLNIGGVGTAEAGQGVTLSWTTAPATLHMFNLFAVQTRDGSLPTFDSGGGYAGATSLGVTTASYVPFIQPLNFVSISTSGSFVIDSLTLEVLPPQYNQAQPHGMVFS